MDATCTIQDSIHVFSLVHKYVSRILGTYQNGWCFFYAWRNLFFLCPFLRKEVSTVANRIMGITVEIGAILAIFPERGQKVPPLSLFGGEKRPTYNKQRVQGKSYLLEQHLDGDISNAYLAVNLRSIKAAKTAD